MKQDTNCLIETLRLKEAEALFYKPAADRLEELQRELDGLKRAAILPEPSRLEIAAMAMQAFIGTSAFIMDIPKHSLEYADTLIAAAKEAK
jgi:hypothetical protein